METVLDVALVALIAGGVGFSVVGLWERWLAPALVTAGRVSADGPRGITIAARQRLGRLNARWLPPRVTSVLSRRIAQAGDEAAMPPEELVGLSQLGCVIGLAVGVFVAAAAGGGVAAIALPALVGLGLPWLWLDEQVKKRHLAITRALPFALDLLTLSVEAGLDFASALAKVAERGRPGPLRSELEWVTRLLKMGRTREEALKSLAARIPLPAVVRFVSAVVQADRMGSGLARTLRIQAEQLRTERTHRAEKLANQAPVKLLFPLVVFIFPNVFAVLFGPIVFALLGL
jgi:tight adherence protein C